MAKKKRKTKTRTKTTRGRKKGTRKKAGRRGRPPKARLDMADTQALLAELGRRQAEAATLEDRRDALLAEAAELDAEIQALGGVAAPPRGRKKKKRGRPLGSKNRRKTGRRGRPGRRPGGGESLPDALQRVLTGKTMGVSEAADAVQAAGYKTTSPNFRTIVNQALIKHTNRFKKVSRGQYTAK